MSNPGRHVRISWSFNEYFVGTVDGLRIRIEASEAANMPNKIFAYQLVPAGPADAEPIGMFDHVCSPSDLQEYPEDEPVPTVRPAWFRLAYVDLLLRSRAEVDDLLHGVLQDVAGLKAALDAVDDITASGTIVIS